MPVSLILALLVGVAVYEAAEALLGRGVSVDRLQTVVVGDGEAPESPPRRTFVEALLVAVSPGMFERERMFERQNIVNLLRRSGYHPYATPGEYYAAVMGSLARGLVLAAAGSGLLALMGVGFLALPFSALILFNAYRRPLARIKRAVRRRSELMRQNMLVGLTQLSVYLEGGMGVQEALRRTGSLGGPFCNLLAFFAARLEVEDPAAALRRMAQHVPDPEDVNMRLFLNDLEGYFLRRRPLARAVRTLRDAVRRDIRNATLERAATVKRRAVLFGVFAVIGLLLSGIAPAFVR